MNIIIKDINTDQLLSHTLYNPIDDKYVDLCIVGICSISFGSLDNLIYIGVQSEEIYEVYLEQDIAFKLCVDILMDSQNSTEWFVSEDKIIFKS
jgi:hypothetical protein